MGLTFVSLKAFGDFVIACHALRLVRPGVGRPPGVIAGEHLRPLATAIGFTEAGFIAGDRSGEVPAAFDIRRCGWLAAMRSLGALRRQFGELSGHDCYIFDRLGWRERWLVPRGKVAALPLSTNIYEAYAISLRSAGHVLEGGPKPAHTPIRSAVIVPASRLVPKTIPSRTIAALADVLKAHGVAVQVLLLEGDHAQVPSGLASTTIPRRFPALIERLKASDLVISADSLAAHLAEFHGIRCFVVGPRTNSYWLPASCMQSDGWCLFDDVARLGQWLERKDAKIISNLRADENSVSDAP